MEGKTNAAELKRLINKLLDRMDERELRVMYAHANRVYCSGYSNEPLQRDSQPKKRETGGNDHLGEKDAKNAK